MKWIDLELMSGEQITVQVAHIVALRDVDTLASTASCDVFLVNGTCYCVRMSRLTILRKIDPPLPCE